MIFRVSTIKSDLKLEDTTPFASHISFRYTMYVGKSFGITSSIGVKLIIFVSDHPLTTILLFSPLQIMKRIVWIVSEIYYTYKEAQKFNVHEGQIY